MKKIEPSQIRDILSQSRDVIEFITNLYVICKGYEGKILHNGLPDKWGKQFPEWLQKFKFKFEHFSRNVFGTQVPELLRFFPKYTNSHKEEFPAICWAFLKAIDGCFQNEQSYLNTKIHVAETAKYLGNETYYILLKPKNLILENIKKNAKKQVIRDPKDIGQHIEYNLENLILFPCNLSPSKSFDIKNIDEKVNELLKSKGDNLSFAIAPIYHNLDFRFDAHRYENIVYFNFNEIGNNPELKKLVEKILDQCIRENINILILPELTINEEIRNFISQWLKTFNEEKTILMVIAGSYHMKNSNNGKYDNDSIVFRYDGVELWKQTKLNQFCLTEDDIKRVLTSTEPGFDNFRAMFNDSDNHGYENIDVSNKLYIFDSSIGRMAVAICIDYFAPGTREILEKTYTNLIFVPSMSETLGRFRDASKNYGTYSQSTVFCANSCWMATRGSQENFTQRNAGFIYTPKRNGWINQEDCLNCIEQEKCCLTIFRISDKNA